MNENEANKANYEELAGHISILGAKLKKLAPQEKENIETLEDTYERALQMRVMHNNTLTEELKEKEQMNNDLSQKLARFKWMVSLCSVVIFFVAMCIMFPDQVEDLLQSTELWTHLILFCFAVFFTKRLL